MVSAESFHDVGGKFVAGDTNGLVADDTGQGDDRDAGGTPTNIDDHVTDRFLYIDTDTKGGCHGLMYQVDLLGTGLLGTVPDGPFFYFGDAGWNTDHHPPAGREKRLLRIDHFDHLPDHQLRRIK